MSERAQVVTDNLLLIQGGQHSRSQTASPIKLLRIERYLARQAKAAHNLGVRSLEHYYNVGYLALRVWRIHEGAKDDQ
jgi:hypothetical protein